MCRRWPFDWKTPFGYLMSWLIEFTGTIIVGMIAIPCFNMIVGSCWLLIVIAKDITNDVTLFNNIVKKLEKCVRAETTESFFDIIQNYSDTKE